MPGRPASPPTPGRATTVKEEPAPSPPQLSQEAVRALITQVLAVQPSGITQQQALQISEVLATAIPAAGTTPHLPQGDDHTWSRRVSHAQAKLRYWQEQHDARKEAQRRVNRQLDDAMAHIEYWQATLASAQSKDPQWVSRDPYAGTDSDLDSLAGVQDDEYPYPTDTEAPGNFADHSSELTTTGAVPLAGHSCPQSPFSLTLGGEGKEREATLTPDVQHRCTVTTEGSNPGYPPDILAMAAAGGHTWECTRSAYEVAHLLYDAHNTRGLTCHLTCNPLIQRMVEIMVANNRQVQARTVTLTQIEHAPAIETAAEAGII